MLKFKKVVSLAIAGMIAISMSTMVSAEEMTEFIKESELSRIYKEYNIEQEIQKARNGITDVEIDKDKLKLSAEFINEEGYSIPIEVDATIKCYSDNSSISRSASTKS